MSAISPEPVRKLPMQIGIAIVEQRGRVLVGVRDSHVVLGGKHEFPGGKCQPRESPAACAIRECREETGLSVAVLELLLHTHHVYDHGELDLSFFLCRTADARPPEPQGNFCWIAIDELPHMNFPAGNRAAIDKLVFRQQHEHGLPVEPA